MNEKPMSSAQMKVWPGAKEADGLQQELGTELRPADDLGLYALVLENNRLLKALTERLEQKQPDSDRLMLAEFQHLLGPLQKGEETPIQVLERILAHLLPFNPDHTGGVALVLLESRIRDAALEEAVSAIPLSLPTGEYAETVERIRALKSKPAPQPSGNPGEFE